MSVTKRIRNGPPTNKEIEWMCEFVNRQALKLPSGDVVEDTGYKLWQRLVTKRKILKKRYGQLPEWVAIRSDQAYQAVWRRTIKDRLSDEDWDRLRTNGRN